MIDRLVRLLRHQRHGSEVERARHWQAVHEREERRSAEAAREAFLAATRFARAGERLAVGRAADVAGQWQWCGEEWDALWDWRLMVQGSSGGGKTLFIVAFIIQCLLRGLAVVLADFKGELAQLMCDVVIPYLVACGHTEFLEDLRVLRPFSDRVPHLRYTQRETGRSLDLQVLGLAAILTEAVGEIGARMQRAFLPFATAAVLLELPLPIIATWLRDRARFLADARRCGDPTVLHYAQVELAQENAGSLSALSARLATVFHLADVRLALSAPACVRLPECLERGVTIGDFASHRAASTAGMRLITGPFIGSLTRAVLAREITPHSRPTPIVLDEVQEALGRFEAESLSRLWSLSRFRATPIITSNQDASQIGRVDPGLLRVMRTSATAEASFRTSLEDARAMAEGITARRPGQSLAAARAEFVAGLTRLPRRSFYYWPKGTVFGPQLLRSPRLDLDHMRRLADTLPPEVRERIRMGTTSTDRQELMAELRRDERRGQRRAPLITPDQGEGGMLR